MGPPPWAPLPLRDDLLHVGSRRWASGFSIGIYWGYHGDNVYKTYKPTNLIHDAKKGVSENESHWLWGHPGWLWGNFNGDIDGFQLVSTCFNLFQLVSTCFRCGNKIDKSQDHEHQVVLFSDSFFANLG